MYSYHSGHAGHLRFLRARDCYSEPEAVYRVAGARGMDLVTITDHKSIDGCLELLDRHPDAPDFFISEEIDTPAQQRRAGGLRFKQEGRSAVIEAHSIQEGLRR